MSRRVVVTGMGAITPMGLNVKEYFDNIKAEIEKKDEKISPKSPKSLNPSKPVEYVYVPPNGPPAPPPKP